MDTLKRFVGCSTPIARVRQLVKELTDEELADVEAGILKPRAALAIAKERKGDCIYREDK